MVQRLIYFLLFLFALSYKNVFPSHGAGMDISYECISQGATSDTYKITIKYYRDCSSSSIAASHFTLNYSSSCNNGTTTLPQVSGPVFITPLCSGSSSPCANSNIVELEEYIYQTTLNLDHCNDWTITVCASGHRNSAITTILNPTNQDLCVEAEINNLSICNNSPSFTEYPAPYICANQAYCYNNGAFDIDGDSLVYSLETPNNGNAGVTYIPGFSAQSPISGITNFDPLTGDLCMTSTQTEVSVLAMKITEYRNGVEIGSVVRDIQIIILSCLTSPPVLTGFNGVPQNVTNSSSTDDSLHFCANDIDNINFNISSILGSSNNKNMSWSGVSNAPTATFTITNNNSNNPSGNFNWTPQYSDVINSPFTFTINVEDDACPINNLFSYTYTITLSSNSNFNINYNQIINPSCIGYNNGSIDLMISGITGLATYSWNGPNNFTSINEDIGSLVSGTYFVLITDDAGCAINDTISIIDPSPINIIAVIDSVSCIGGNDGGIDITITPNSGVLNYSWTGPNGFSSNNEDINTLVSGTYNLLITDSVGCTFNESIIVPAPNPFNTTIIVNDISCYGEEDGTINLIVSSNNQLIYNWIGPNGFSDNNQDIDSLISGIYEITITDINGCMFIDSVILEEPINIISTTNITCCNNYFWNNNTYYNSGIYIDTLLAANGCDSIATLQLTINNPTYSNSSINACDEYFWNGVSYTSSGTYNFNTLNSVGCDSIATLNLTINNSSYSTTSIQDCNPYTWNGVTYNNSGVYTYSSINSIGCDSIATLMLQITSYNITSTSPICQNDSVEIILNIIDPSVNEYIITINDEISSYTYVVDSLGLLVANAEPIKLIPAQSTNFIVESIVDINSCENLYSDTAFVVVNPLPLVTISDLSICFNEESFILEHGDPEGGYYFINDNQIDLLTPSNIEIGNQLIEYHYTDPGTNCANTDSANIIILPIPMADFYCDTYIAKQDTPITFFNSSSNFTSIKWYLTNETIINDSLSFSYSYSDTGLYLVELIVENEYYCYDTATANILILPSYIIHIPTAFTPGDNDTLNNSFRPFGEGIKSYDLTIFNRWGEKIFYEKNTPWDGKNSPEGVYAYVIHITSIKNLSYYYRGSITIIR